MKIEVESTVLDNLAQWLGVMLDQVDYTSGACSVTEMVGAVLPKVTIEQSHKALEEYYRNLRKDKEDE